MLSTGHHRSADKLVQAISKADSLDPKTLHLYDGRELLGLSTTRCRDLAFRRRTFGGFVLELSHDALRHHNKIMPIDGSMSFYSQQMETDSRFVSDEFEGIAEHYHERTHQWQLAEDFVVGPIKRFRRCINHAYILCEYGYYNDEFVEKLIVMLDNLNIPYTEEINPGGINPEDIVKLHQRRNVMK